MKSMWKKAIGVICAGGLSVMCLAGCGKDAAGSPKIPSQEMQQNSVVNETQTNNNVADDGAQANNNVADDGAQTNNNVADDGSSGSMGDGLFYDGANLEGIVVEFSETGFSMLPATAEKVEGGGKVLAQAIPGSESDENNVQITYTDNTVFQIINFSTSSQSEVSREDTDKESVKKQSRVCVFGSCQDTYHWTADTILIFRFQ